MKSSNIIPMEIRGYFIDDKLCVFSNLNFQWNVGIIYIIGNFKNPLVSREKLNINR